MRIYPNPEDVSIEWNDSERVLDRAVLLDLLASAPNGSTVIAVLLSDGARPRRRRPVGIPFEDVLEVGDD